jgi:hypothetical protein
VIRALLRTNGVTTSQKQESADLTRSTWLSVAMLKAELVRRVTRWSTKRRLSFKESWLDEWIDKGLVAKGDRRENLGKRPVYHYSAHHYRRVLQILRLYGRKIKRTDAILIMLFLNGRGVKPYEVREALGREFARGRAKLNAQARSSRFDESGPIPPKHEESLIRALGKADERLVASNLVPTSNEMIEAVRTARRFEQDDLKPTLNSSRMAGSALSTLLPVFSGLLAYDDEFGGEIEDLLSKATDQQIEQARLILLQIALTISSGKVESDQVNIPPMAEAFLAALKEPVFVANLLVVMLRLSTLAAALPFEELLKAYDFSLAKE